MKIIVKYELMPITSMQLEVMVQIAYGDIQTVPHIIKIRHTKTLVNNDMNDLLANEIEAHIRQTLRGREFESKDITYVSCDLLTPKKISFWQKIKNYFN